MEIKKPKHEASPSSAESRAAPRSEACHQWDMRDLHWLRFGSLNFRHSCVRLLLRCCFVGSCTCQVVVLLLRMHKLLTWPNILMLQPFTTFSNAQNVLEICSTLICHVESPSTPMQLTSTHPVFCFAREDSCKEMIRRARKPASTLMTGNQQWVCSLFTFFCR